jgi:hypothetical protein
MERIRKGQRETTKGISQDLRCPAQIRTEILQNISLKR